MQMFMTVTHQNEQFTKEDDEIKQEKCCALCTQFALSSFFDGEILCG